VSKSCDVLKMLLHQKGYRRVRVSESAVEMKAEGRLVFSRGVQNRSEIIK